MATKNQKTKQTKGVLGQYAPHSGGRNASPIAIKFISKHSVVAHPTHINGRRPAIQIEPLPPTYNNSFFKSKEEYDAMIQKVVDNANKGEAIIRKTPLA